MFNAIEKIHFGKKYFNYSEKSVGIFYAETMISVPVQNFKITKRELEIVKFMVQGLSSKEIAIKLKISMKTVENHRINMLKKSGTKNSIELIMTLLRLKSI